MEGTNNPTGGTPAAPVIPTPTTAPDTSTRLSVPASALDLETTFDPSVHKPGELERQPNFDRPTPTGPSGPAAVTPPPAPATGPTGPADASGPTGPAVTPPPAAPTGPTGPAPKVKIGDKEYTKEELEKILADKAAQNQPQPQPQQQQNQQLTPEQQAEQRKKNLEAENKWLADLGTAIKGAGISFAPTKDELEVILGGGPEGAAALDAHLTKVIARSVLLARTSIYADMNPIMTKLQQEIQPVLVNHAQIEAYSMEQAFVKTHPEYTGDYLNQAKQVAQALVDQYPQQVQQMSREQFIAEVNRQTSDLLQAEYKRWNPQATDSWRDAAKRGATPPSPAAPPPNQQPQAPAANTPARVPAPASNPPAGSSAAAGGNWHKDVASSLRD